VTAAAVVFCVSRLAVSDLLNGKADLSGNRALRTDEAVAVKMDTLPDVGMTALLGDKAVAGRKGLRAPVA
jgi:hypothetical protein